MQYKMKNLSEINACEQHALSLCKENLSKQTEQWHLNSPRKVSACLYIPTRNEYVVSQNIGISKVTGSLCAERAAVATAVSKYPDLKMEELTDLFIVGTSNPLLPCGVCCEWLHQINPYMHLYAIKEDCLVKVSLKDYYGDESFLER